MTFICSQDSPLPFKSNSFRLVVLRHVLEHLYSPKKCTCRSVSGFTERWLGRFGGAQCQLFGKASLRCFLAQLGFAETPSPLHTGHTKTVLRAGWFSESSCDQCLLQAFHLDISLVAPKTSHCSDGKVAAWDSFLVAIAPSDLPSTGRSPKSVGAKGGLTPSLAVIKLAVKTTLQEG